MFNLSKYLYMEVSMYKIDKLKLATILFALIAVSSSTHTMENNSSVWQEVWNGWFGWMSNPNSNFSDDSLENTSDEQNILADDASSSSSKDGSSVSEVTQNTPNGWRSNLTSYLPSPKSYINNLRKYEYREKVKTAIQNLRNYEYRANVKSAARNFFDNFRNDRKTQAGTAAVVLGVGTLAAYAGHKYYKNRKAKKLAVQVPLEKAVNELDPASKDFMANAAQQGSADLEQEWRKSFEELLSSITDGQAAACPAIFEVVNHGGVENPTLFRDNEEVWAILTNEQQDVLNDVIKLYKATLEANIS